MTDKEKELVEQVNQASNQLMPLSEAVRDASSEAMQQIIARSPSAEQTFSGKEPELVRLTEELKKVISFGHDIDYGSSPPELQRAIDNFRRQFRKSVKMSWDWIGEMTNKEIAQQFKQIASRHATARINIIRTIGVLPSAEVKQQYEDTVRQQIKEVEALANQFRAVLPELGFKLILDMSADLLRAKENMFVQKSGIVKEANMILRGRGDSS